jgi:hypothetical protein
MPIMPTLSRSRLGLQPRAFEVANDSWSWSTKCRATYVERKSRLGIVYVMLCRVGDERFLYAGVTETDLAVYRKAKHAVLRTRPAIRESCDRQKAGLITRIVALERCESVRHQYVAERAWIRLIKENYSNVLNGNSGGRVLFGEWVFHIGKDRVRGFLALSKHPANIQGFSCEQLRTRIQIYGWPLPRALWSTERPPLKDERAGPRGAARAIAEAAKVEKKVRRSVGKLAKIVGAQISRSTISGVRMPAKRS